MGRREPVEREVVGVAEDLQISGLYGEREMYVYVPMSQYRMHYGLLLVEVDGDPEQVFGAVRNAIASVDRSVPVLETTTLAAYMKGVLFSERRNASVGLTLGLLALSLAAIGLYGVVSLVTTRRTREMGIRMALGAERGDVVGLVLGRGFRLGISGLVAGIAASVIASRYMASRLPGVEGFDPLTIAVVAVVLLAVTAVASLVPAWRATKVDPTVALRYE
jgi:ABC-type antimicrobial peptide transport system permease subunit